MPRPTRRYVALAVKADRAWLIVLSRLYFIDNAFFTLGFWIFDWKNRPGLIHSV